MAKITAPEAPKAATQTPLAPQQKVPEQVNGVKKSRASESTLYPSAEAAKDAAAAKEKGPRQAWTVSAGGKTAHIVSANVYTAKAFAFDHFECGTAVRVDAPERAARKSASPESIMADVESLDLPEEQKAAVRAALEALKAKKA